MTFHEERVVELCGIRGVQKGGLRSEKGRGENMQEGREAARIEWSDGDVWELMQEVATPAAYEEMRHL